MVDASASNVRVYYFGDSVEYKYLQIIKHLSMEYIPTNYVGILRGLMFRRHGDRSLIVHLRYIQFHGYVTTVLLYGLLILVCKLRGARVVWTCHNTYEHDIPWLAFGDFMRWMLYTASSKVIVFHASLKNYLPQNASKAVVANFGSYKDFILDPDLDAHPEFLQSFRTWLKKMNRTSVDLVFIGEYKGRKNIEMLVEFARRNVDVAVLVVAHKASSPENCPSNLMLHNDSKIFGELDEVLRGEDVVGFVAHDNLSVPTTIHLYADYGVPILGLDIEPISSFINDYDCGVTFNDLESLEPAFRSIRCGRDRFRSGMQRLSSENTWGKSVEAHLQAFGFSQTEVP